MWDTQWQQFHQAGWEMYASQLRNGMHAYVHNVHVSLGLACHRDSLL